MARIVIKTAKKPYELKPQKESKWICMCGLSKNQPFCDKSHKKTADEDDDKIYKYDEKGDREKLGCDCDCDCGNTDDKECDCGEGCCRADEEKKE